jgi:glycosyltransferase involved in cell wall biosynthesis
MPCFNGDKYINEAIESVLSQTYTNIELVIVNDGSEDTSEKVIRHYSDNRNIIYVKHNKNMGIPSARNTGVRESSGELIAFLDQDDLWLPNKITEQTDFLSSLDDSQVGLVFSDILCLNGEVLTAGDWPSRAVPIDMNSLSSLQILEHLFLCNNFIPMSTVVVHRKCFEIVGLLDERILGGADDYEFFLRISAKYLIRYIDRPLAIRRLHPGNYTDAVKMSIDQQMITEIVVRSCPELAPLKRKKYASIYNTLGKHFLCIHDSSNAKACFRLAIRMKPGDAGYWFGYLEYLIAVYCGEQARMRVHSLGKKLLRKLRTERRPRIGSTN